MRRLLGEQPGTPVLVWREGWSNVEGHTVCTTASFIRLDRAWPWHLWGHLPGDSQELWERSGCGPVTERTEIRARYARHEDTTSLYATDGPLLEEVRTLRGACGEALEVRSRVWGAGSVLIHGCDAEALR
ncbi:hypothetical protein [Nocardiopsis coralliicola]